MSIEDRKEFEKLLAQMAEAPLSEEEFLRLNKLMKDNVERIDEYYEHCHMVALLQENAGALMDQATLRQLFEGADVDKVQVARPASKTLIFPSWLLAVAALLIISFSVSKLSIKSEIGHLAVLKSGINTGLESAAGHVYNPGDEMNGGSYVLHRGLAELTYGADIKVVIEGPASFDLIDDKEIFLHQGKIYAATPPGTERFTIATPRAVFNDLGTEFAVEYFDQEDVKLFVFKGKVQAVAANGVEKLLTAGQGMRLDAVSGKIRNLKIREDYFVRQLPELTNPYHRLMVAHSPVIYLPMENNKEGKFYNYSAFLPGSIKASQGDTVKGIIGDAFKSRSNSYLEVADYPKTSGSITILAWIKNEANTNGIVARNGDQTGQFKLYFDEGKLVTVMHDRHATPVIVGSSVALKPDTWNQVAFVYDGHNAMMYVNGRVVATKRESFEGIYTHNLMPSMFVGSGNSENSFSGFIDEFAIFNKALTPEALKDLYNAATP